jgi:hypothetical protein
MSWQLAAAAGIAAILAEVWWIELTELRRAHGRSRAVAINAFRFGAAWVVILSGLFVIPASSSLILAVHALVAGVLIYMPVRWVLRCAGREPKWALQDLLREGTLIEKERRSRATPDVSARLRRVVKRIDRCRTSETSELCDLMIADFEDSMAGRFSPLYFALRTVRIHELEVQLYGQTARPAELDPPEATFRWRLHRDFGGLIQAGAGDQSHEERALFGRLADDLDHYRRPDTEDFIDAVQASARAWLSGQPNHGPWPPTGRIEALGSVIDAGYRRLWPRTSVFWGAQLDESDRQLLSDLMVTNR